MVKHEKLLERIRRNPKAVRFDELDTVLRRAGFEARQVGSHVTYTRGLLRVTVPHRVPHLLPTFVRQALEVIDKAVASDESED